MYYVDGYNTLHQCPDLSATAVQDFETARNLLVDKIARFCGASGVEVTLVFDGRGRRAERLPQSTSAPGLNVVFSARDQTADSYIERCVHKYAKKQEIVVVTSDRGIRTLCLGLGAFLLSPDRFLSAVDDVLETVSFQVSMTGRDSAMGSFEERLGESDRAGLRKLRARLKD